MQQLFLYSDNIADYKILKSNNSSIDNSTYTKNKFRKLKESFIILGFNNGEVFTIFKILAAILLLGNIQIKVDKNYDLNVDQKRVFLNICNLLNIDPNEFATALVNQEELIGSDINDPIINVKYKNYNKNEELEKIKCNLANELYKQLFLWVINRINNSLNENMSVDTDSDKTITFFDFCGYVNNYSYKYNDIIYLNSLEQLFINYINELIFYFYLKDYFLTNLKLFQKEGINYIVDQIQNEFNNKKDILNTINYLLNELKTMEDDKDIKTFISNLEKDTQLDQLSKKKYKKVSSCKMIKNSQNPRYFLIHHTNEDVYYNLEGFVNKNIKNYISWNILDCLLKSSNQVIINIYKNNRTNTIINDKKSLKKNQNLNYENMLNNGSLTFGEEYKYFIKEIKKEIKQSQRNYIICLKSNQNRKPLVFTPIYIFNQLKYFKILFSIKQLEKNMFPVIINFTDFYYNYKLSQDFCRTTDFEEIIKYNIDSNSVHSTDIFKKQCISIINNLIDSYNKYHKSNILLNEDMILFGKKKILMKERVFNILEEERNRRIDVKSKNINTIIVGMNYLNNRTYFREIRNKKINTKIALIQAMLKGFYEKSRIRNYNGLMFVLQNSLRIINARQELYYIKKQKLFLSIRLQIFLEKIKEKEIQQNIFSNFNYISMYNPQNNLTIINNNLLSYYQLINNIDLNNIENVDNNTRLNINENSEANSEVDKNKNNEKDDNVEDELNDLYSDKEKNSNDNEQEDKLEENIDIKSIKNQTIESKEKRLTIINPKKYSSFKNDKNNEKIINYLKEKEKEKEK